MTGFVPYWLAFAVGATLLEIVSQAGAVGKCLSVTLCLLLLRHVCNAVKSESSIAGVCL
jgi:hypothetical protein